MSDVEKFFYAIQEKLGGNLQWSDLDPFAQIQFVQAINSIIQATSAQK